MAYSRNENEIISALCIPIEFDLGLPIVPNGEANPLFLVDGAVSQLDLVLQILRQTFKLNFFEKGFSDDHDLPKFIGIE